MEIFIELLKVILPSLLVFTTAYFLLKMLLDERQRVDRAILRNDAQKITLPLRLQAYERLTLLCDRVNILNASMRVRTPGMKVKELRGALMLLISQEFDHNTSQQLYVSETLWKIIQFAKTETLNAVTSVGEEIDPNADAQELFMAFAAFLEAQPATILDKAIMAIRTEAGQLF
ncbi:MAG: hypothetical protein JNJ57_21675 [Saprospiraceae bacterium]|nr:hypothetical protein [Saprospiraceae bacterium]